MPGKAKISPVPSVNVSRSRTMIARLTGTTSSSGESTRRRTLMFASSGRKPSTVSSSRMTPSSIRIIAATAVTGLDIDEMRKIVSRS